MVTNLCFFARYSAVSYSLQTNIMPFILFSLPPLAVIQLIGMDVFLTTHTAEIVGVIEDCAIASNCMYGQFNGPIFLSDHDMERIERVVHTVSLPYLEGLTYRQLFQLYTSAADILVKPLFDTCEFCHIVNTYF